MGDNRNVASELASERPGVAEYFGRLAKTYGAGAFYARRRAAVINALRSEIPPDARLLDLGCGNGANLFDLRAALDLKLIAGADLSRQMLAEAAQRRSGARVPLLCADAMALPFPAGAWDVVFCSHVLQMVPDLDACLRGIAAILTHGGALMVAGGGGGAGGRLLDGLNDQERELLRAGRRAGRRLAPHDRELSRTAYEAAGFAPEYRRFEFVVSGAELVEWYRIRWIPVLDDSLKAAADTILDQLLAMRGAEQFATSETLVLARRL